MPCPYAHGDANSCLENLKTNRLHMGHPYRALNRKSLHLTRLIRINDESKTTFLWIVCGTQVLEAEVVLKLCPRGPHLSFRALARKESSSTTTKYPGAK